MVTSVKSGLLWLLFYIISLKDNETNISALLNLLDVKFDVSEQLRFFHLLHLDCLSRFDSLRKNNPCTCLKTLNSFSGFFPRQLAPLFYMKLDEITAIEVAKSDHNSIP